MKLNVEWKATKTVFDSDDFGVLMLCEEFTKGGGDSSMWKKIGKFLLKVILPWVMTQVSEKKAEKLEKVVDSVTDGVEAYNFIRATCKDVNLKPEAKVNLVKKTVGHFAEEHGVTDYLHDRVQKYQGRVKDAVNRGGERVIEKLLGL